MKPPLNTELIQYWDTPTSDSIGTNPTSFLLALGRPTIIRLAGRDASRTRMISTLLHGNEPSGLHALHKWLHAGTQPAVDTYCFIGNVKAALCQPLFSHRHLHNEPDLNRCFKAPFSGKSGAVALELLNFIKQLEPECMVDIHNTSGNGPAFAVSTIHDTNHSALSSLFTPKLIISHLHLGALMETSNTETPIVTIECGGAQNEEAHRFAYAGLSRYLLCETPLNRLEGRSLQQLYYNPIRVELSRTSSICFSTTPSSEKDVTLHPDIEHYNFAPVNRDTPLGWVKDNTLTHFIVLDENGKSITEKILRVKDGKLFPARELKLFMATNNAEIAHSDCMFYAVHRTSSPTIENRTQL